MRRAARLLAGLDGALARVEAALLCLLLGWLCAGGIAQVVLQNAEVLPLDLLRSKAAIFISCLLSAAGLALVLARRDSRSSRLALFGCFLLLLLAGLHLGTATDRLLRAAVLWIAMLGGSLATRHREHITIEALEKLLPAPAKRWAEAVVAAVALVVLLALVEISLGWVGDSRERGEIYQRLGGQDGGVPKWCVQAVLPLGFILMAWRFALILIESLSGERILPARRAAPGAQEIEEVDPEVCT